LKPGKAGFPGFSTAPAADTAAFAYALESACLSPAAAFRSGFFNLTFFGCISGRQQFRRLRIGYRPILLEGSPPQLARLASVAGSV
jgi:hypothetical protein